MREDCRQKGGRTADIVSVCAAFLAVFALGRFLSFCGPGAEQYFHKGLISAIVFGAVYLQIKRSRKDFAQDAKTAAISSAVSFFLIWTELLGIGLRLSADTGKVNLSSGFFLWSFVCGALLCWLVQPFLFRLFRCEARQGEKTGPGFVGCFALLTGAYLPCLFAFWPGLYCYDMSWQWEMFVNHDYSTHHPLLHTWVSGILLEGGKKWLGSYEAGLSLYGALQLLVFAACVAYGLSYLRRIRVSRWLYRISFLFYLLYPYFAVLSISTTKDVCFGGFFLIVFVGLCDMAVEKTLYRGRKLAGFLTVFVLMLLLRNNALYATLFLTAAVLLFAWIQRKERGWYLRLAGICAGAALISVLCSAALTRGFSAQKGSIAEMMSVPCQQMARTYSYHAQELGEEKEELLCYFSDETLRSYKYYVSDPVKAGLDVNLVREDPGRFIRLWLSLGENYPGEYVLATLYNTMGLWYLGGESSCSVVYDWREFFNAQHHMEQHSLLPWLQNWYRWFQNDNLQEKLPMLSMIFYTSFYSWASFAAAAAAWAKGKKRLLVPAAMLAGYLLTLVLGPCIMVRYMLGVILCVPVYVSAVWTKGSGGLED